MTSTDLPDTGPTTSKEDALLARETERRRTFAIISHPDAGKTTLTEKLLLYGRAGPSGMRRATGWSWSASAESR